MAVSLNIENVLSLPLSDSYYTSNLPSSNITQLVSPRIEISQLIESTSSGRFEVFNNGLLSITLEQTMMMSSYHVIDELRIKNVVSGVEQVMGFGMIQQMSLCIGYDETTHVTYYLFGGKDPWGSWNQIHKYDSSSWSSTIREALYEAVIGSIPVLYNWSSVPAISGKNGILSLTQILNINDGEPVEDVTNKGNLDFSKKTKVNTLINSAYEPTYSEDETKATVSYDIPESDYQYTKLVYKKKKIPKSVSDGDAIDLNADATEIVVNNLDEDSKYYFKIFTDKTQSNSYKYSTGSNPLPEGKWQETVSTCKATDDSFSMSFTEDTEQWKINQSGATDEWVWLSSLGGYNLTTCSVDAETALNNLNLITDATLNVGNHPARYYSTTKEHFDKTWNWDNASFVHIQQNGTGYIGWDFRFTAQFFGNFNMQYTTTEVCYGGDFMIAVNHYTMQAVFVWLRWSHHDGNPMALAKTKSSISNTLYYCITKFIN